jgi:hypothetical protein
MSIYRPYHLFLLAGVSLMISALIVKNDTIDIHIHDTYFVLTRPFLFWVLAILTYFLWGIYLVAGNVLLASTLTWLHVGLTLFAITLFICLPFFSSHKRYMDLSASTSFNRFDSTSLILTCVAFTLLVAQVLFFINIIGGIIKRLIKK